MSLSRLAAPTIGVALIFLPVARAVAVQPSELLLPGTTKGFVSSQDIGELRRKFSEMQLGKMASDPLMKPFLDDLQSGTTLGIPWHDIERACGSEAAVGLIQPDEMSHATALIIDITGKRKEADELLKRIAANQQANKAVRSDIQESGIGITAFTQPLKEGQKVEEKLFHFINGDQLIVADHEATVRGIVHRLDGKAKDSLASVRAFQETMKRCSDANNGVRCHIRWFVEPLGYARARRAAHGGKTTRGKDPLQILQTQGFSAIQGIGGHVHFATDDVELIHRTFIYAPAVPRDPNDKRKDKYDFAMRMLDFPNSSTSNALEPQAWAPPDVASYLSFHWKIRQGFEYSSTLVDAFGDGKGYFDDLWLDFKRNANGPQIDIRSELLDHLGTRVTLLADVKVPVNAGSERIMVLIEVNDAAAVAKTVAKAFVNDNQAKQHDFKGQIIWEINQNKGRAAPAPPAGNGKTDIGKGRGIAKGYEKAGEPELPNLALTVYLNHLIVATHVDYLQDFIALQEMNGGLGQEPSFRRVRSALVAHGSNKDSIHFFSHTDESYRATYELFKQGKLPEAETMFARLLNSLIGSREDAVIRKQRFDGSKLPEFDLVKEYFGPSGLFVQSENDGWWLVGCLLVRVARTNSVRGD